MKYIETSPKRLKTTFDSLVLLIALIVFSQQKDTLKQGAPFEEFLINVFAPIQSGITSAHTKALSSQVHTHACHSSTVRCSH